MRRVFGLIISVATGLSLAVSVAVAHADPVTVPNAAPAGGSYVPVTPFRLLDTHTAISSTTVTAGGHNGVPTTGVSAVAVTLSAVAPAHAGSVVGYRPGAAVPSVTNLIFGAGDTTTAANVFATDASGAFAMRASTPARVLVDVTGYFTDAAHATTTGRYVPLDSSRLYDSRSTHAAIPAHGTRTLTVAGTHGVPTSGAQSVVVNIVAVSPKGSGYLTAYAGSARPYVTTLSYRTGVTRADRFFVRPDSAGRITIFASAATDLIVDVNGYFADSPSGGYYIPLSPQRWEDTRSDDNGAIGSGRNVFDAGVAGRGQVPFTSAMAPPIAVLATLTSLPPRHSAIGGYLVGWPDDRSQPATSDINFTASAPVSNLLPTGIATLGAVAIAANQQIQGRVNITLDVSGYFAKRLPDATPSGVWQPDSDPARTPSKVNNQTGVQQLASGSATTVALLSDHTVDEWPQTPVQNSDAAHVGIPAHPIGGLHDIVAVAAALGARYALDTSGRVWAWGDNGRGQLGDGTTTDRSTPVQVADLPAVVRIFAGSNLAFAVAADGTTYGWGGNDQGRLGDGTTTDRLLPVVITGLSNPVSVAGSYARTEAVLADGSMLAWGRAASGTAETHSPQPLTDVCPAKSVVTSTFTNNEFAVLCSDGTVSDLPGIGGVTTLATTARYQLAALRSDGTVWIRNGSWQRVVGLSSIVALTATFESFYATTGT